MKWALTDVQSCSHTQCFAKSTKFLDAYSGLAFLLLHHLASMLTRLAAVSRKTLLKAVWPAAPGRSFKPHPAE